jgi:hypothetical protein
MPFNNGRIVISGPTVGEGTHRTVEVVGLADQQHEIEFLRQRVLR